MININIFFEKNVEKGGELWGKMLTFAAKDFLKKYVCD